MENGKEGGEGRSEGGERWGGQREEKWKGEGGRDGGRKGV